MAKVYSCSFVGLDCQTIEVQADISNGLPQFSIVGLGDTSVQESKERIRASIKNSGLVFPPTRKTINLAPAQVRKQGSLFDLPIAISLLIASGQISPHSLEKSMLIGELSLDGKIRGVNGVLAITHHAKEKGFKKIFLSKENAQEAAFIEGIEIFAIASLNELVEFLTGRLQISPYIKLSNYRNHRSINDISYFRIVGLPKAKRALMISAAGHHNILFHGSPGRGKTILARALKDLLTDMSKEEILQTSKIFSVAGLTGKKTPLIFSRPFREVHHTATTAAVIGGGGAFPKPGEISLAHNGVLLLDEITEFKKDVLESLRQPLEDRYININRANFSTQFPCNFILIGTMNPCPCGYLNDLKVQCKCSDRQVQNYQKKLSGPLLDRFDLFIEVEKTPFEEILSANGPSAEEIEDLVSKIILAKKAQNQRFKSEKQITHNTDMNLKEIRKFCKLGTASSTLLNRAAEKLNLSNRSHLRVLKIARTIADLENSDSIKTPHIAEALQYRK